MLPLMWLVAGFVGLVVLMMVLIPHLGMERSDEDVGAYFREAATTLGARSSEQSLELERGAVECRAHLLEATDPERGPGRPEQTRVTAGYSVGSGPVFEVRDHVPLSGPDAENDLPLVETGERAFDRGYFVRGVDAPRIRRVLTPTVRAALRALEAWVVESDGRRIVLLRMGSPGNAGELVAAVEAAVRIASEEWTILEGYLAVEGASVGKPGQTLDFRGDGVMASLGWKGGGPRLEAAEPTTDTDFTLRCDDPSTHAGLPPGLAAKVRTAVSRIGAATFEQRDGRLRVAWDAPPEPSQLGAAWDLLRGLLRQSTAQGAFR